MVTLQRLLLTSTPVTNEHSADDLANTARIALLTSSSSEKNQLLQGILFTLHVEIRGGEPNVDRRRGEVSREGPFVGLVLASTLRLCLWLYPSITSHHAWLTFKEQWSKGATDSTSPATAPPDAWDSAIKLARDGDPLDHDCIGTCMLLLGPKVTAVEGGLDGERLVKWFTRLMRRSVQVDEGDDGTVSPVTKISWSTLDKECAGSLFLDAWGTVLEAMDAAGDSAASYWTTTETIEAFAIWLHEYYKGSERVEVRLGDLVILLPWAPIDPSLVSRFIAHVALTNGQAAEDFKLEEICQGVGRAGTADRDAPSSMKELAVHRPVEGIPGVADATTLE